MARKQMQLEDWLDDLCVRFVINLPQEDLSSVARICFQVEEAQWFYEDFIRPLDPTLPSMSLRTFCLRIFQHCPLLASFPVENHVQAFEEFIQYKTRVPVRGAIMLNSAMDSVVLVKGWKKGANWSFPRGKINKDEDDLDCAIREVYEETGLDLREAGLVPKEAKPKYIEIPMREQHLRLYVIRDVPMDTNFQPRTRKEISKIEWYKLSELPTLRKKGSQNGPQYDSSGPGANANKFYMVAPFLVPLKKWIISQKKAAEKKAVADLYPGHPLSNSNHLTIEEEPTAVETRDTDVAAPQVPNIESLDGATRELQRLLNVQPKVEAPAPPVPPPPPENKASALLSLLQPTSAASHAARSQSQSQSQHQAPRPQPEAKPAGHPGYLHSSPYPGFNAGPQSYVANPVPMAQSLPPPRYGQASSLASGGFPQASPTPPQIPTHSHPSMAYMSGHALPTIHQPPATSRQAPLQGQALALLNAFKQGPAPPPLASAPAPREPKEPQARHQTQQQSAPSGPTAEQQPFTSPYSQYALPAGISASHAEPKSPGELVGSIVGPARQEQHKSALLDLFKTQTAQAAEDRSKGKEASIRSKKVIFDPTDATSAEKSLLAQLQNKPLANPSREPSSHAPQRLQAHDHQQQHHHQQQQVRLHPEDAPIERAPRTGKREKRSAAAAAANKPAASGTSPGHPRQSGKSPRNAANNALSSASASARTAAAAKPAGPQPTRILQRGQSLQSLGMPQPAPTSPSVTGPSAATGPEPIAAPAPRSPDFTLHSGARSASRPLHANAATNILPLPIPGPGPAPIANANANAITINTLTAAARVSVSPSLANPLPNSQPPSHPPSHPPYPTPNYQADVSQEQKRQLLSLFGAAPQVQVPRQQEPATARAGSSTGDKAISQADQSFLLDYLQSVTNNAAGR